MNLEYVKAEKIWLNTSIDGVGLFVHATPKDFQKKGELLADLLQLACKEFEG